MCEVLVKKWSISRINHGFFTSKIPLVFTEKYQISFLSLSTNLTIKLFFRIKTNIYMGNTLFAYLQQLELILFFSGYSLLYAFITFFFRKKQSKNNFKNRMASFLPYGYALTGSIYFGLQLKNLFVSYASKNIIPVIYHPYLISWALFSIVFWVPALRKRKALSLIHSLVFFFLLVKDMALQFGPATDMSMVRNDMRIYTTSLLINIGAFLLIILLFFIGSWQKKI